MQVTYGIGTSTEIAYYSYIYAKVDAEKYQKVTSFTRVATLSSIFLASVTGQVKYGIIFNFIFSCRVFNLDVQKLLDT
jgi:thiamine transporter 2/3